MIEELAAGFPILSCLLFLPFVGAAVLWLVDDEDMIRTSALTISLVELALAVFVYGEAFSEAHARGFALIWAGLIIYMVDLARVASTRPAMGAPASALATTSFGVSLSRACSRTWAPIIRFANQYRPGFARFAPMPPTSAARW